MSSFTHSYLPLLSNIPTLPRSAVELKTFLQAAFADPATDFQRSSNPPHLYLANDLTNLFL